MTAGRDQERQLRRASRLRKTAASYGVAQERLQQIHGSGGRAVGSIVVRNTLITRREAGGRSPAVQLVTPKGLGLHLYLTALFDAQCRRPPGSRVHNTRPLLATGTEFGWTDMLPTITTGADTDAAMLRQVLRALTALERCRLVELRRRSLPGRFEQFKLLDESGGGVKGRTGYVIPNRAAEEAAALVWIPITFFLRGWVHVLLPAEILVYLTILDLEEQYGVGGVYVADRIKDAVYSITRDVYEHHRALTAYGLIERLDDPNRRADGRFVRRPPLGEQLHPYRFRSVRDGLDRDAQPVVAAALSRGW